MAEKRPKRGGRKKGTPNKFTASIKEALRQAFDELGGVDALAAWGRRNRTEFYKLWAKSLPQEIKAEHTGPAGGPIEHEHVVTVTGRIEHLAAAFAGAADREEAGAVPGDRPGEPLAP